MTVKIALAVAEFNYDITMMMAERAREHAKLLGAEVVDEARVTGSYDLPFAVKHLLDKGECDGVIAIGCVVEGETDHDEVVIQHAARKLVDLSLEYGKPVTLGITGPKMSRLQAMDRIDNVKNAVESLVRLHKLKHE